jgi:hypothetical protein
MATLGRGVVGVISVYVEERRICPTLRRIVRLAVFSSIGMMFERRQVGDVSELESLSHGSTGVGRGIWYPDRTPITGSRNLTTLKMTGKISSQVKVH